MDAREGAKRVNNILCLRNDERESRAETSRKLGKSEWFLRDQLRSKLGLRTQIALEAQQVNGVVEAQELYYEALFSLRTDPAGALVYAKEHQRLKPDPFIQGLLPRLRLLAVIEIAEEGEWPGVQPKVRRLDWLRRRDRRAAWAQLQELISGLLDRIEKIGSCPRRALGEIAVALGVIAAIYRLAGRRDDAVDLLCHARPLVLLAKDVKVEAEWLQKGAYLLVDLSYILRANDFVLMAHMLYDEAHAEGERLSCQVDLAYVYYHAKDYELSMRKLYAVLPHLLAADTEGRVSANQLLALNLSALGDIQGAARHLDAAIALAGDDLLAKAYCLTSRGELLVGTGDINGGLSRYQESLPLLAKVTGAGELAEVAMIYAKLLLQEGRRSELRALATDLSGWIHELKGNYKLRCAVLDLQSLIATGELDERRFAAILAIVAAAKPTCNRRTQT